MKKIVSIMLVAALAMPMFAGEKETPEQRANKDYTSWLPAEGDFSFGIALDPFTRFIGNAFNGTAGVANTLASPDIHGEGLWNNLASIMGSYMVTDNLGIRANVGLNFNNRTYRGYAADDEALYLDPLSIDKVVDMRKNVQLAMTVSAGVEYRVGKRSVQGVFGGGIMYGNQFIDRDTYSYGNKITEANQNPTVTGDAAVAIPAVGARPDYPYIPNARTLSTYTNKGTHMVGIYGTVGVEWFVAPKIALGANVNVRLDYEWTPNMVSTYEGWNIQTKQYQQFTEWNSPVTNSGFDFNTNNLGANLYVAFYFSGK
ncbi:MAG: hypothetical protein IJV55_03585 [Paludibacteraceae bacterium]|nr:hypothetical protein [Paludibacteraceae bacterium]